MIKDVTTRTQNKRIAITLLLCVLYFTLSVIANQSDTFIPGGFVYFVLLVYGFICLCRIILTEQKRTIRFILPLIMIVATLIVVQSSYWPYAKFGFRFGINIGRQY